MPVGLRQSLADKTRFTCCLIRRQRQHARGLLHVVSTPAVSEVLNLEVSASGSIPRTLQPLGGKRCCFAARTLSHVHVQRATNMSEMLGLR